MAPNRGQQGDPCGLFHLSSGVVIDDRQLAERVTRQFDQFVDGGVLRRLVLS